jgi:SAM-dependent methyltransferase
MQSAQFQLHAEIEQRHWWFTARRKILRRLVDQMFAKNSHATIIDVGCGTGANIAGFADAYNCVGIDTNADAIHYAKERFPTVQFLQGFAPEDLGDLMRKADVVMLNDVLEHVGDDFLLLSRLIAEMKEGAKCLVTVPANLALWSGHDESFGHYRRYDVPRLEMLWRELPVEARLVSYFNSRLYPVIRTVRGLNRMRGRTSGLAGTDFKLLPGPVNGLLDAIFSGESEVLVRALRGQREGYSNGASIVAVIERVPGHVQARSKPTSVAPDYYDPQRHVYQTV